METTRPAAPSPRPRWVAALLVVAIAAGWAVFGTATGAQAYAANDYTTAAGYRLAYDPSVVAAAAEGQPAGRAAQMMNGIAYDDAWDSIVMNYGQEPDGAKMSAGDLAIAQKATAGWRGVVATRLGTVGKVAGNGAALGGSVLTGVQLGAAADRLLGVDLDGNLCPAGANGGFDIANHIVAGLTGTNCDNWNLQQYLSGQKANSDATSGVAVGTKVCSPADAARCFTVIGSFDNGRPSDCLAFPRGNGSDGKFTIAVYDASGVRGSTYLYNSSDSDRLCPSTYTDATQTQFGSGNFERIASYRWEDPSDGVNGPYAYVTAPSGNPSRTFRCDVTLGSGKTVTASTAAFTETDSVIPAPQCPAIPGGDWATHTRIVETGGSGDTTIWDADTTDASQQAAKTRPGCQNGSCALDLLKAGRSCFTGVADCAGWFEDPDKADTYSCVWGGQALPLDRCNAYAPTFDPAARAAGRAYADPTTGQDAPPGVQTSPQADAAAQTGASTQSTPCFPSGWGVLNPVEWVQKPVQCALRWAFVPDPDVVAGVKADVAQRLADSPPGQIATVIRDQKDAVSTAAAATGGASGCQGIDVDLTGWQTLAARFGGFPGWDGHARFLNACPGSVLAPYAAIASALIGLSFVVGGVLVTSRLVGRIFGYTGTDGS